MTRFKCTAVYLCTVMSVKGNAFDKGGPSVVYRTASYMACEDCGEGAMVWDEKEEVTKCSCCGEVYEGRP